MSGSLNRVLLIGRLGQDVDFKVTPNGDPLARFSVATSDVWTDKNGERQEKTSWHNCVVFGKQAEIADKYLRKGAQVYVEGKIEYREVADEQGNKKNFTNIRVNNFLMLGKRDGEDEAPAEKPAEKPAAPARKPAAQKPLYDDDGLPF